MFEGNLNSLGEEQGLSRNGSHGVVLAGIHVDGRDAVLVEGVVKLNEELLGSRHVLLVAAHCQNL